MQAVKTRKADPDPHLRTTDLLAKVPTSPGCAIPPSGAAQKLRKPVSPEASAAGVLSLQKLSDETSEQALASAVLMPPNLAATSLHQWQHGFAGTSKEVDVNQLLRGLVEQVKIVCDGDLGGVKSRLLMQATVLDAIFFKLNTQAIRNIAEGGTLDLSERLLKLAFRAQSQSRSTDETLALLEHPKTLFVAQQNNSAGHQQVLNSRARKKKLGSNKLLDDTHDERLDTRAPGTAVGCNPAMEAVEEFDRTSITRGKGNGCSQRLSRGRH